MIDKIRNLVLAVAGFFAWLPPLVARITIGYVFLESGWGKFHHLDSVTQFFTQLKIPAPQIQAPFVAGNELVCGALVLAGLFTRLASIPIGIIMVVAIATAKIQRMTTFSDLFTFSEFLYIVLLAYLFTGGAGPVSLDRFICKNSSNRSS
jgi:putative oxidoreductase